MGWVLGAVQPLPAAAAALEGADVHLCPSVEVLSSPGEGLTGGGGSGWFVGREEGGVGLAQPLPPGCGPSEALAKSGRGD